MATIKLEDLYVCPCDNYSKFVCFGISVSRIAFGPLRVMQMQDTHSGAHNATVRPHLSGLPQEFA
jgi:hypothetical protein